MGAVLQAGAQFDSACDRVSAGLDRSLGNPAVDHSRTVLADYRTHNRSEPFNYAAGYGRMYATLESLLNALEVQP